MTSITALSTPLVTRSGRLVGMITTHWHEPHVPAARDLRLLDILARQAADLVERARTEQNLRRNHETFFGLIQNAPFGIYIVDSRFRLRQVSAGAQKVFQNVRPLIGRDFADVLRSIWEEPFASEAIARFRHTLETGEPYVALDTTEQRHDVAEVESYDWRLERITLPDGQFGVVCHFYDLSDIRRAEAEICRRVEEDPLQCGTHPQQRGDDCRRNHRLARHRRVEARGAGAEGRRPPQGRVSRHARPRTAQSARSAPHGAAAPTEREGRSRTGSPGWWPSSTASPCSSCV